MEKNSLHRNWWALVGLSLSSFITAIDFAIVNTALPTIQNNLALSLIELQWVMNSFVLAICVFITTMGNFGDLFGRKKLLYVGVILFVISSITAGFSENAWHLIISRALQGLSVAIILPCSLALVAHTFPLEQRGKALGIWAGINAIGLAAGPALGGILVGQFSWPWVFFINIPFALLSLLICWWNVDESKNEEQQRYIDWAGFVSLTIGVASLVLAISQGKEWGWNSPLVLGLFAAAVIFLIALVIIENKQNQPLLDFKLFSNRIFLAACLGNFQGLFFSYAAFFLIPLYLQNIRQELPFMVGLMLLPISITVSVLSPIGGYLNDKFGSKLPICVGLFLFAISALLQFYFRVDSSNFIIFLAFIIMGLGWGLSTGPLSAAGMAAVPKKLAGTASGVLWTARNLGGAVGLALSSVIFYYREKICLSEHVGLDKQAFMCGFNGAMLFLSLFTVVVLLVVYNLLSSPKKLK